MLLVTMHSVWDSSLRKSKVTTVIINGVEVNTHDIYSAGYDAAKSGKPVTQNPYDPMSYEGSIWEDGWYNYYD